MILLPESASVLRPTGQFSLVDHDGRRVDQDSYRGFYRLVYFGFTHCKVVCPRTLTRLSTALEQLGGDAGMIRPLYITVDPDRDTPEALRAFLRTYPRFIGLSGSQDEIGRAKQAFRVFSRKVKDDETGYAVPHSSIAYLMVQDGTYAEHFLDSVPANEIAKRLLSRIRA